MILQYKITQDYNTFYLSIVKGEIGVNKNDDNLFYFKTKTGKLYYFSKGIIDKYPDWFELVEDKKQDNNAQDINRTEA